MIRHIVWWELKPECRDQAEAIQKNSESLKAIPSARSVDVSIRILKGTTVDCQIILVSTHDDEKALEAYAVDPIHLEFARLITNAAANRSCINYEIM